MKEYRVLKLYSEELNKEKRIYIYLPKSYTTTDKFYPVLYMHDGQNLFDDKTAHMNVSWNIMDIYEENPELPELIIVGIESDQDRAKELIPYEFEYRNGQLDGGNAENYLLYIAKTLKPYIDRHFRTFKSPKNTGIMGSSFGGVNSTYAALKFSNYFSRFGCVSNAYFFDGFFPKLKDLARNSNFGNIKKFYMDVGTNETNNNRENDLYVESNKEMYEILKSKIEDSKLKFDLIDGGIHHETDWEKRFPEIINYMFND